MSEAKNIEQGKSLLEDKLRIDLFEDQLTLELTAKYPVRMVVGPNFNELYASGKRIKHSSFYRGGPLNKYEAELVFGLLLRHAIHQTHWHGCAPYISDDYLKSCFETGVQLGVSHGYLRQGDGDNSRFVFPTEKFVELTIEKMWGVFGFLGRWRYDRYVKRHS
jgi:hypothetical protein